MPSVRRLSLGLYSLENLSSPKLLIRPAIAGDLPRILELYRFTMGGLPKMRSEAYWKWKHLDNPFGASPVMLAWEGDELIGMRVFLRWQFLRGGRVVNAYRAVDTATHPAHRGKGIFTALTMHMLSHLEAGPPALIFNTPNASSKPGYLKMGWQTHARTRLLLGARPFARLFKGERTDAGSVPATAFDFIGVEDIISTWQAGNEGSFMVRYSPAYLQWRYAAVPVADYEVALRRGSDSSVLVIYRMKRTKGLNEMRICEVFLAGVDCGRLFKNLIDNLMNQEQPDVVTLIDGPCGDLKARLPKWFFRAERLGLDITVRELNDHAIFDAASAPGGWYWSAGTLELF